MFGLSEDEKYKISFLDRLCLLGIASLEVFIDGQYALLYRAISGERLAGQPTCFLEGDFT
ncbi:MAG: hypothetical protein N2170_06625 [Bacteroidia bacterium]|nr:hypothetical protein [Bacteroidia bacterium]